MKKIVNDLKWAKIIFFLQLNLPFPESKYLSTLLNVCVGAYISEYYMFKGSNSYEQKVYAASVDKLSVLLVYKDIPEIVLI